MRAKDRVGRFGEDLAADHLTGAGWQVVDRNWRCPDREFGGELDIVARDGDALVFVEVKTRSTTAFGTPADAVDRRKAARIRRLAVQWMEQRRRAGDAIFWSTVRFDVVSVLGTGADATLDHLAGSF